jgi:hypothetical protein
VNVHYALQTCDIANNQGWKRIYGKNKTELVKKCVTSFFESILYASQKKDFVEHRVMIIDDRSTEELQDFLQSIVDKYSSHNIIIEISHLENGGVMKSIGACYEWLLRNGTDLVYQVQDDYLFKKECIYETIDMYFQILENCQAEAVITPYNAPYLWNNGSYRYSVTPRMIVQGVGGYWIQNYDVSCSFLTSAKQLRANADLLKMFLDLDPNNNKLESISLNYMFTRRGMLSMCPINSLALHMQTERERDPYVDWKPIWDSIEV